MGVLGYMIVVVAAGGLGMHFRVIAAAFVVLKLSIQFLLQIRSLSGISLNGTVQLFVADVMEILDAGFNWSQNAGI